jgi:hypothetical protein
MSEKIEKTITEQVSSEVVNSEDFNAEDMLGISKEDQQKIKNPNVNPVKSNKSGNPTIKGLRFENILVIYNDEIGTKKSTRITIDIPEVDVMWYQPSVRKKLSLWFNNENIIPSSVSVVQLPSKDPEKIKIDASFFDKPVVNYTREDIVNASIYFKLRTVLSVNNPFINEIQESLWKHYYDFMKDKNSAETLSIKLDKNSYIQELK